MAHIGRGTRSALIIRRRIHAASARGFIIRAVHGVGVRRDDRGHDRSNGLHAGMSRFYFRRSKSRERRRRKRSRRPESTVHFEGLRSYASSLRFDVYPGDVQTASLTLGLADAFRLRTISRRAPSGRGFHRGCFRG